MDFDLSEEQQAVSDLAAQILGTELTHERLVEVTTSGGWFAEREWQELAKAGLVGIALPTRFGGAGLDVVEACLVLEQVGRTVAPVPYLSTVMMAAVPLARFGTPAQREQWLPAVAEGRAVLGAGLLEGTGHLPAEAPATAASPTADGWVLQGRKRFVPWASHADRILVPAATPDGTTVFLVDPRAEGVSMEHLDTTSGEPQSDVVFDGTSVTAEDVVGDHGDGEAVVRSVVDLATAGICATQAGVCLEAIAMIGRYTSERHQFNAPIATFQAVAQRAADAYIDANAVLFTARQAAWRLSSGLPADDALDIAKYWAAEGGQRVVHAAQHLHGGIGVDKDYPLHRYFLWAKVLELSLGGATERLRSLGRRIAAA